MNDVLKLFAELNPKKQIQVYRTAHRRAANILVREARKQLRLVLGNKVNSRNKWNGKTLQSGIKARTNRAGTETKIHIMGDFRLKFFEMGTGYRKHKKTGKPTGRIKRTNFFTKAMKITEDIIFNQIDNTIEESIIRIASKTRTKVIIR